MLKRKALSATFWSGAEVIVRQGVQFGVAVILARFVTPEEFGTIALLYLFTSLGSMLIEGGLSSALIQRKDTTLIDESTVFWFNLGVGAFMSTLLWLAAPWIAAFYEIPVLVPLSKVLAVAMFISSIGLVHTAILTKQLNFAIQLKIGVIVAASSSCIAVALAWKGYGVWALASQLVVSASVSALCLWLFCEWRPMFKFSSCSMRKLTSFGGYLMVSNVLDVLFVQVHSVLIGKFYGASELGYYRMADTVKQLPANALSSIISRVIFPVFSSVSDDKEKLKYGMALSLKGTMFLNVPLMLGTAAVAEPLILVLFGEAWISAIPVLKVLALAGIFWPLHVINLNVLISQGHSRKMFQLELVKKLLGIILLFLGALYGVMGIAWSQVVFGVVAFFINAHYSKLYLSYGFRQQFFQILPVLLVSGFMSLCVYNLIGYLNLTRFTELIIGGGAGVVIYFGLSYALRLEACRDVIAMLSDVRG